MTQQDLYDGYMRSIAAFNSGNWPEGQSPNNRLMRLVENACGVPEDGKSTVDFRRTMLAKYASDMLIYGKHDWTKDRDLVYVIQQIVGGE